MRRSLKRLKVVIEGIFLVLLICVGINVFVDRQSKILDNVDITWDEVSPKPGQEIQFAKEKP